MKPAALAVFGLGCVVGLAVAVNQLSALAVPARIVLGIIATIAAAALVIALVVLLAGGAVYVLAKDRPARAVEAAPTAVSHHHHHHYHHYPAPLALDEAPPLPATVTVTVVVTETREALPR